VRLAQFLETLESLVFLARFMVAPRDASRDAENHPHAVAIHFLWCNFAKSHQTLRMSPAMAADVTDRVWDAEDIVGLLN
jgi:hypothetical protein